MTLRIKHRNEIPVALVVDSGAVVSGLDQALDLMADAHQAECDRIILRQDQLHPDFFDLKTGFAGAMLQKYMNYQMKIAIVGDFSQIESRSLRDFIRESNRGGQFFFCPDEDTAMQRLCDGR